MSDDRTLLETAARATGHYAHVAIYGWNDDGGINLDGNDPPAVWNPLTDDGDALRLAVALRLSVMNTETRSSARAPQVGDGWIATTDPHKGDAYAATRRAIVMCAAQIGKAVPCAEDAR